MSGRRHRPTDPVSKLHVSPLGGPLLLAALSGVLITASVWNFSREVTELAVTLPPIAAAVLNVGLAVGTLYAAFWLLKSEYDAAERWGIALTSTAGALILTMIAALTIIIRTAEGRIVGEAIFVLIVNGDIGAIVGVLVGIYNMRARRDARQAERERDKLAFLNSILRHDILNSMMIIQSRGEFLAKNTEGRNQEFAATIVDRSDNVVNLVERTRAMLEILTGEAEGETGLERVDLASVLDDRIEIFRSSDESVTFNQEYPSTLPVRADDLLANVIENIIANAIEHNDKAEAQITISTETVENEENGDTVRLRIADNGPGIPDQLKDAVFRRDETGIHEDGSGSGFGLFFVDTMIERYDGDVWIEDNEPEGAVVVLELPVLNEDDESGA
ncbi:MAG: ATP-binding protein [Halobacteriales archaeon]